MKLASALPVLQLQEVGDYEASAAADLPAQNPARAGHKASFNH